MKYGAPKLEMLAVVTFVKKFESFPSTSSIHSTCGQPSIIVVENVLNDFWTRRKMVDDIGSVRHGH